LARAESLELLHSAVIGRIVFTMGALPAVRPVNFRVLGGEVYFRLRSESNVAKALDGVVVAFEADEIKADVEEGWSVVVTGVAEHVAQGAESDALVARLPRSWVPGPHDLIVRLRPELVTGRRIGHAALPEPDGAGGRPSASSPG
jgi:nitroimidazol reductase NimA-like FMN-containing flavoprotein (pyridoxamine 5'-phosphate oxidase superfamily)